MLFIIWHKDYFETYSFVIFQGVLTSIPKETYSFLIFQGLGGGGGSGQYQ